MKKYELLDTDIELYGKPVFRIKALRTFKTALDVEKTSFLEVQEGDLGGYIQSEDNLSQTDSSWINKNSHVIGNSQVLNNSYVSDSKISGNAIIDSSVIQDSIISEDAVINNSIVTHSTIRNITKVVNSDLTELIVTGACNFYNTTLYGLNKFTITLKNNFDVENISGNLCTIQKIFKNDKEIQQLVIDEFMYYKISNIKYLIDEKDGEEKSIVTTTEKTNLSKFEKDEFLWKLKFSSLVDITDTKEINGKTVYKMHNGGYISKDSDLLYFTGEIDEETIIISSVLEGSQSIRNSIISDSVIINTKISDSTVSNVIIEDSYVHFATIKNISKIYKTNIDNITLQNMLELYQSKIVGQYNFIFDGYFGESTENPFVVFSNICLENFSENSFLVDISKNKLLFIVKPNEDSFYTNGYFYVFNIGSQKHVFTHILINSKEENYTKIDFEGNKVTVKSTILTPFLQQFAYTNLSVMRLIQSNISKKYELIKENFIFDNKGNKLYQIKALINFGNVKKGELGGYISEDVQLNQFDDSWVDKDSIVAGKIKIQNSFITNSKIFMPVLKNISIHVQTNFSIKNSKISDSFLSDVIGLIEDSSVTSSNVENYMYLKESCVINLTATSGIIVESNCKVLDKKYTEFKYITKLTNKKNEFSLFDASSSVYLSGYLDENSKVIYNLFILNPNYNIQHLYSVMHIQKNTEESVLPAELNSFVAIIKENLGIN